MEVGELVAVALKAPHSKAGCPFCRPKEEVNETNYLRPNFDEDSEGDNDTDNSSGTLAKNLVARPQGPAREVPKLEKGEDAPVYDVEMASAAARDWHQWTYDAGIAPVLYGAHHLIPGNDGLVRSDLYAGKHLGPVDDGPSPDNIGYNINSSKNGTWLPGNYAIRPWEGKPPPWQQAYAFLAMYETNRQFHDAHKQYSGVVRRALNELAKLVNSMKKKGCPACHKGSDPDAPPYHLNSRLNAISNHLAKHLRGNPARWKDPMFTSRFGKQYKDEVKKQGGLGKAGKYFRALAKRRKID
jgi:hypothetical protein